MELVFGLLFCLKVMKPDDDGLLLWGTVLIRSQPVAVLNLPTTNGDTGRGGPASISDV